MVEDLTLNINGREYRTSVEPLDSHNHVLRDKLGLTGTKRGCDTEGCGACTVIVDGRAVYSCVFLACKAVGKKITTVEGLSEKEALHPVQQTFIDCWWFQCGYCTLGLIISIVALLNLKTDITEMEVREAIAGNLYRCSGYVEVVDAALAAVAKMKK